jgi:hypothetical protein
LNTRVLTTSTLITFGVIMIASYLRIYLGIDFTDEAFYISLPYRFVLGNLPIVDEQSIYQFAGVLTYPFFKVFHLIYSGNESIVLYARHLYFLAVSLLGLLTFTAFKHQLGWQRALLIASICVLYTPFNIMGLSYNALAMLTFTAGLLTCYMGYSEPARQSPCFILSGFFFSLAVFAYPTFSIPVLASVLITALLSNYKKVFSNFSVGVLPLLLLLSVLIYLAGSQIENIFSYLQLTGYTNKNVRQFYGLYTSWFTTLPHTSVLGIMLLLIFYNYFLSYRSKLSDSRPNVVVTLVGLLSALTLPWLLVLFFVQRAIASHQIQMWHYMLNNLSLLAPIYYPQVKQYPFVKKLMLIIWLPSFIAGLITALSSGNGLINFMVGALPAFIVFVIVFYLAVGKIIQEIFINNHINLPYVSSLLSFISLLSILMILLLYKYTYFYRDASLQELTWKVSNGPYRHLWTSSANFHHLNQISLDLAAIKKSYKPKSIICYPSYSGVYLLSGLLPETNSVWLFPKIYNQMTLEFFLNNSKKPDIAFIAKNLLQMPDDPLVAFFNTTSYYRAIDRGNYTILVSKELAV